MAILDRTFDWGEWKRMAGWGKIGAHLRLPEISACYLIILAGEILYAGKAANLRNRFAHHQLDANRICYREYRGDPERVVVKYRPVNLDDLSSYERWLIHKLRPSMNICFNRDLK